MKRRAFLFGSALSGAVISLTPYFNVSGKNVTMAEETEKKSKIAFKLGLASYSLREFKRPEALAMCKRAGLGEIAFKDMHLSLKSSDEECATAAEECKKYGIRLYGAGVVYMRKEDEIENAFRYAKAAGMDTIIGVPEIPHLPLVEKLVKETGIRLAIHNHGPGDGKYGDPQKVYDAIKEFDVRIGLCLDIGHTFRLGINPSEVVKRFPERIHDLHIKDMTASDEKGQGCICGRGAIDFAEFFQTLIDVKYDKVASFEYEIDGRDPLPGLMESVGYTKGIMKMLDRG